MDPTPSRLRRLREAYPDRAIGARAVRFARGQFNDVLIADGELVFRFPRTPRAAELLQREAALLHALRGRLPLPIPDPLYADTDAGTGQLAFVGYRLIPGDPMDAEALAAIGDAVEPLASLLAGFLRALHRLPAGQLAATVPAADGPDSWRQLHGRFEAELFPHMRPDARDAVSRGFERFLAEPAHFAWRPVLRHGDFGGSNILIDPSTRAISGIIDFGAAALGDPAVDLAALSGCGERFLRRVFSVYPELAAPPVQERARFYRSTHALQQALWALEAGDAEELADGLAGHV